MISIFWVEEMILGIVVNDTFIVELSSESVWETTGVELKFNEELVEVVGIAFGVDELTALVMSNVLSKVVWTVELEFNKELVVELGVEAISLVVLNVDEKEVISVVRLITFWVVSDVAS